jgi:hypothetical protein
MGLFVPSRREDEITTLPVNPWVLFGSPNLFY